MMNHILLIDHHIIIKLYHPELTQINNNYVKVRQLSHTSHESHQDVDTGGDDGLVEVDSHGRVTPAVQHQCW